MDNISFSTTVTVCFHSIQMHISELPDRWDMNLDKTSLMSETHFSGQLICRQRLNVCLWKQDNLHKKQLLYQALNSNHNKIEALCQNMYL